jgi:hypothetical protein
MQTIGGMAERPNVTASKTVGRVKPARGFKSLSRRLQYLDRKSGKNGEVAERPNAAALKAAVRGETGPGVRIPSSPHTWRWTTDFRRKNIAMGNDQAKTESESEPPYLNAPSAEFAEEDTPVYTLVGAVLDRASVPEDAPVQIQIAPGLMREYDAEFLPVFEFFKTPRREHQVREWLEWAGGDDEILRALIDTRAVVRVDARTAMTAATSLKGLRVVPQCRPVPDDEMGAPLLCKVTRDGVGSSYFPVELCEYMWSTRNEGDIPGFVKRLARQKRMPREKAAWHVLCELPMALQWGYARLEWIKAPRV